MPLHPALVAIRRNLPRVAKSQGFQARVTSAYRSRAAQTKLYNRYIQGLQPYPVAVPGTSDHEKGLALDVVSTNTSKLVSLLTSAGLSWAGPSDPVHFTLVGSPALKSKKTFVQQAVEGAERTAEILWTPMPLKLVEFARDPIGTIKANVSTAFDVLTWLV